MFQSFENLLNYIFSQLFPAIWYVNYMNRHFLIQNLAPFQNIEIKSMTQKWNRVKKYVPLSACGVSVWLDGARKCVIVTSARRALPVRSAHCLTGLPWARLSPQPTRLLLFPAQCYVLLSKYVKGGGQSLSVRLSVNQVISPLGYGLFSHRHFQLVRY